MRTTIFKLALSSAAFMLALSAVAQAPDDPKYGATETERYNNALNLSFFNEAYNSKDYATAIPLLQDLLVKAPAASENLYARGISIYGQKAAASTNLAERNMLVDSIMLLYDLRLKYFGDHESRGKAYILARKAQDYLYYKPADREGVHKYFKEAIEANGNDAEPELITGYFKELVDDYKNDAIETEALLNEYDRLSKYFDTDPTPEKAEAKKVFEQLFIMSDAADCDALERIYGPQLAANPSDTAMMAKTFILLARGNCKSDFMLSVGEKYYALKPRSDVAMMLAAALEERKENDRAIKYLTEAMQAETDPGTKANIAIRIAGTELSAQRAQAAANYARQAISINPESGLAYLMLAQAYVIGTSGCGDAFTKQTVYWLASDALSTARRLLADDADQVKSIDSQLAAFRGNFPSAEECFFRGIKDGDSYDVSCGWISGRTTVRERK
ncbi:MAG: enzyme of heme biosynthesis [Rikenellaceae bacterium]|nr:enzyme of heme biosynthesis [Rikenellaceae bacterium]